MEELQATIDLISAIGPFGLLVLFTIAHYKGWIRWGKDCEKCEKNLERCLDVADRRNARTEEKLDWLERETYGTRPDTDRDERPPERGGRRYD